MRGALALILACLVATPATAATYYVAQTGGNNNRSCATATNVATPKAAFMADGNGAGGLSCLTPGDTLLVRTGTYNEQVTSVPSGSATGATGGTPFTTPSSWPNQVRIANYNGEVVLVRPSSPPNGDGILQIGSGGYIEFDGINFQNVLTSISTVLSLAGTSHHVRIKNAEITQAGAAFAAINLWGTGGGGFELQNVEIHGGGSGSCGTNCQSYGIYWTAPNSLLEDSDIYDVSARGISVHNGQPAANNVIRRNRIHDITRTGTGGQYAGIFISSSAVDTQIYNNWIWDIGVGSAGAGIWLGSFSSPSGTKIWNNTIYSNNQYGIRIEAGATATEVRNNIGYLNGSGGDYLNQAGAQTTASNNIFGSNPQFADAPNDDFHLTSSSTGAINLGCSAGICPALRAAVTTDIDGHVRPQGSEWDIGADEFISATSPTVTILLPTPDATYTSFTDTINLSGTASDDGTVTDCSWATNQATNGSADGTTTWVASEIPLVNGVTVITVTCVDNLGNLGTDPLTVTFSSTEEHFRLRFRRQ